MLFPPEAREEGRWDGWSSRWEWASPFSCFHPGHFSFPNEKYTLDTLGVLPIVLYLHFLRPRALWHMAAGSIGRLQSIFGSAFVSMPTQYHSSLSGEKEQAAFASVTFPLMPKILCPSILHSSPLPIPFL